MPAPRRMLCPRLAPAAALLACWAAVNPALAETWMVVDKGVWGDPATPWVSSRAFGEFPVGAVRSVEFELDADIITFEICGWDGRPGDAKRKNWFALCDAQTGAALRVCSPPNGNELAPVQWDVVELVGRRVYFRAIDGIAESGYAWMGWANVRLNDRDFSAPLIPGRLPEGGSEETRPEGVTVGAWLKCEAPSANLAVEMERRASTWGIMTRNGENRSCAPYLSSLKGGESGTGAVRSPSFTITTPEYTFLVMGADGPGGDQGLNLLQLVDAQTTEILRVAEPVVGNTLVPVPWDTRELTGRPARPARGDRVGPRTSPAPSSTVWWSRHRQG